MEKYEKQKQSKDPQQQVITTMQLKTNKPNDIIITALFSSLFHFLLENSPFSSSVVAPPPPNPPLPFFRLFPPDHLHSSVFMQNPDFDAPLTYSFRLQLSQNAFSFHMYKYVYILFLYLTLCSLPLLCPQQTHSSAVLLPFI